jgi:hypothetical protein
MLGTSRQVWNSYFLDSDRTWEQKPPVHARLDPGLALARLPNGAELDA